MQLFKHSNFSSETTQAQAHRREALQLWSVLLLLQNLRASPAAREEKAQRTYKCVATSGRNMEWDKKNVSRWIFSWVWHMIMCRLRIQKIKIRPWGDFEKWPKILIFWILNLHIIMCQIKKNPPWYIFLSHCIFLMLVIGDSEDNSSLSSSSKTQ